MGPQEIVAGGRSWVLFSGLVYVHGKQKDNHSSWGYALPSASLECFWRLFPLQQKSQTTTKGCLTWWKGQKGPGQTCSSLYQGWGGGHLNFPPKQRATEFLVLLQQIVILSRAHSYLAEMLCTRITNKVPKTRKLHKRGCSVVLRSPRPEGSSQAGKGAKPANERAAVNISFSKGC